MKGGRRKKKGGKVVYEGRGDGKKIEDSEWERMGRKTGAGRREERRERRGGKRVEENGKDIYEQFLISSLGE